MLNLSHCSSTDIINVVADLEEIIEKLKKRVKELEADREILKKDIDRLSEYSHNLETMMRSNK